MKNIEHESLQTADLRKKSHLDLAFHAQNNLWDQRFYYEPMLSSHPKTNCLPITFGNKTMQFPIWISSMTGGTSSAGPINRLLAQTAKKYGFGMGLGSCRVILEDHTYFDDFNLRPILGDAIPLFANIGIAQIEKILANHQSYKLKQLIEKLDADGLIIHVNPLQEWIQPEGDMIQFSPLTTIQNLLNEIDFPIIVKEVGQGFGPESMKALLQLPILAIDFAANGGTNFSKLELLRNQPLQEYYEDIARLGHSAYEMVDFLNIAIEELKEKRKCNQVIISGGIKNFLDGYYCISKVKIPAIYGQAAPFLKEAIKSQQDLDRFAEMQIKGLLMSNQFLKIR